MSSSSRPRTRFGDERGFTLSELLITMTVMLVMLGAVVNAEAERQTHADSTVGPPRPLGQRQAVVADSVPPYERTR